MTGLNYSDIRDMGRISRVYVLLIEFGRVSAPSMESNKSNKMSMSSSSVLLVFSRSPRSPNFFHLNFTGRAVRKTRELPAAYVLLMYLACVFVGI
jgi:hypothetical protein